MGNYDFKKDLKEAKPYELLALKKVEDYFNLKFCGLCEHKQFDIAGKDSNGNLIKFEVKHDIENQKTGNIAIEFSSWGKPSGIEVTQADWWIQIIRDEYHCIHVDHLRNILSNCSFRIVKGGDKGSNTWMYLINEYAFIMNCFQL